MSEKLFDSNQFKIKIRTVIDLESVQQLRDLVNELEATIQNNKMFPGQQISVEITPTIELRFDPTKNKTTITKVRDDIRSINNFTH